MITFNGNANESFSDFIKSIKGFRKDQGGIDYEKIYKTYHCTNAYKHNAL